MVAEESAKKNDIDGVRATARLQLAQADRLQGAAAARCRLVAAKSLLWSDDEAGARMTVREIDALPQSERDFLAANLALLAYERGQIRFAKDLAAGFDLAHLENPGPLRAVALTDRQRAVRAIGDLPQCAAVEKSPYQCVHLVGDAVEAAAKVDGQAQAATLAAAVAQPQARAMLRERIGLPADAQHAHTTDVMEWWATIKRITEMARTGRIDDALDVARKGAPLMRPTYFLTAAKEAAVAGRFDDAKRAYDTLPNDAERSKTLELIARDAKPPPPWLAAEIERIWSRAGTLDEQIRMRVQTRLLAAESVHGNLDRVAQRIAEVSKPDGWPGAWETLAEQAIARGELDRAADAVSESLRLGGGRIKTSHGDWTSAAWPLVRAALLQRRDDIVTPVMRDIPQAADAIRLEAVQAYLVHRDLAAARRYAAAIEKPEMRARGDSWIAQVATLVR
ncbi:hypothetical protein [Roseiterribacter gracilis]|uniref:Uncharacterized protein n=1 Tax=Roseiterribacter gracilis TaxID=2812848 RepID=A0A8S8XCL0_9PROT|nr:hypothetical protein TMPK1_12640 [Rhodospirillales bacterium TMPK1]